VFHFYRVIFPTGVLRVTSVVFVTKLHVVFAARFIYFRYITMAFPVGNLAALRTFRVLRALKTVAVVPGKELTTVLRVIRAGLARKLRPYSVTLSSFSSNYYTLWLVQ